MLIKNILKLDEKDRKILHELDVDARQSYSKIGKKVGLSIPSVRDRIKSLMDREILLGYLAVINTEKIGYTFFNIYLKTHFPSWEEEQSFIEFLKNHPNVGWFATFSGTWTMKTGIIAKDRNHFEEISREIFNRAGKNLIDRTTTQPLAAYVCKHKFLDDEKVMEGGVYRTCPPEKLDEADLKVLLLLDQNPRMPLLEIAKKAKLTVWQAKYRMKTLMEKGVLQEFRPIINLPKLGYHWYHIQFRLNASEEEKNKFIAYLKAHPHVFYIIDLVGACNVVAEFLIETNKKLEETIKEIKDRFSGIISSYEPLLIIQEHKH
jgi:Lrp/AsnC family leucine-responsive transcriptional regulator